MPMPDYLTVEETAALLGYSAEYVRRMLRNGKLSADKKSGVWLVHREAADAYQEAVRGLAKTDPRRGAD